MKKTGIINSQLIGELTRMRHRDKIMICDAGFPVPEGKTLVDVSLVAGLPTVDQVLKAICNEILIEDIVIPLRFEEFYPEFFEELKAKFANHEFSQVLVKDLVERAYDKDVKLFIRTGEVRPMGNILLSSASGATDFNKLNVTFENVCGETGYLRNAG